MPPPPSDYCFDCSILSLGANSTVEEVSGFLELDLEELQKMVRMNLESLV